MNRNTTAAFRAYARSTELTPVLLVEAGFDSGAVNLWTGNGSISYAGVTYTGAANLLNVQRTAESLELRANNFDITLSGIDSSILSIALSEAYTGRPIVVKNAFIAPQPDQSTTFTVKVDTGAGGGNKYFIEELETPVIDLKYGNTYIFDLSDSSLAAGGSHPFRLSTTSDGTHNSGTQYTTGWTMTGSVGTAGAKATFVAPASGSFPATLYYYCANHSGMGGTVEASGDIIVSDPYTIFDGFMDVMKVEDSGETATVNVSCESSLIALERAKTRRYTPEDQAIDYPNDKGFEYVAALQDDEIIWGRG